MAPVAELVEQARAAGVIVSRTVDGRLRLRAPRRAAEIARSLRSREAEVLALLAPGRRCHCGAILGVRLYVSGYRCPTHTPAALAGHPEPDAHPTPARQAQSVPQQLPDVQPWPAAETGRCATCRRPCHRYGNGGSPLCTDCQHQTGAAV